jgi:hypothetical protein
MIPQLDQTDPRVQMRVQLIAAMVSNHQIIQTVGSLESQIPKLVKVADLVINAAERMHVYGHPEMMKPAAMPNGENPTNAPPAETDPRPVGA